MNANDSGIVTLTNASSRLRLTYSSPNLSPNGSRAVYARQRGNSTSQTGINTINSDGSNVVAVLTGEGLSAPSFSPDGSRIAFIKSTFSPRNSSLVVMNANGSNAATLLSHTRTIYGILTDSDGNYAFTNLPADGDYSITAFSNGYSFAPPQVFINALTGNVAGADFTRLAPPAAPASVGGRVRWSAGKGVFGAQVSLTDTSGAVRCARTDFFGRYRFDDVPTGETYIISVSHKLIQFAQNPQILSITEDNLAVNFVAIE